MKWFISSELTVGRSEGNSQTAICIVVTTQVRNVPFSEIFILIKLWIDSNVVTLRHKTGVYDWFASLIYSEIEKFKWFHFLRVMKDCVGQLSTYFMSQMSGGDVKQFDAMQTDCMPQVTLLQSDPTHTKFSQSHNIFILVKNFRILKDLGLINKRLEEVFTKNLTCCVRLLAGICCH